MSKNVDFSVIGKVVYSNSKHGKIKTWSCDVFQDKVKKEVKLIIQSATGLESKKIVNEEVISGKNIGRANETTPLEQAQLEALSRYKEKFDKGYDLGMPKSDIQRNTLGFPMPMLAYPLDKVKDGLLFPCIVQPKLDGHRCMIDMVKKQMYSRGGQVIDTMQHILKAAEIASIPYVHNEVVIDGELYIHGNKLQDTTALIKKYRPGESEKVKYVIYDIFYTKNPHYGERLQLLEKTFSKISNSSIELIPSYIANNIEEVMQLRDDAISEGYEGVMYRRLDCAYEPGHRSYGLLKVKKFYDAEYKVIDIVPSKERTVNNEERVYGLLVCRTNGKDFTVTAPGTAEEKAEILANKSQYINKLVTVKYASMSKDKLPQHPVALRFREDV